MERHWSFYGKGFPMAAPATTSSPYNSWASGGRGGEPRSPRKNLISEGVKNLVFCASSQTVQSACSPRARGSQVPIALMYYPKQVCVCVWRGGGYLA